MGALYARQVDVGGGVTVLVPTVGEIVDHEDAYYGCVQTIIATPYDLMVELDDAGVNFTEISDYELFLTLFPSLIRHDTSLIFGNLDLTKFKITRSKENGDIVVCDEETGVVIDKVVHSRICACLRKMLSIERVDKRPGNEEARKYMLERARQKRKRAARNRRQKNQSPLESQIIALVNTEQFPYNYDTVRSVTIFQFYASLKQISHKIHYDNVMSGYYAGTIKPESLKQQDRTWMLTE